MLSPLQRLAIEIVAVVLVAVALLAGWNHYISGVRSRADAAGYARRDTEQKAADNKALTAALADVARLNKELGDVQEEARTKTLALGDAERDAAAAGNRLRDAVARFRAKCLAPGAGAAAADGGAAAAAPERMLADMSRRLDEAADRIARHADQSRIAGLACERAYGALKPTPAALHP